MNSEAKVALVTGASRGIGRAIAIHLSKLGFIVVGTATTDKGAKYINDYLSEINKECLGMALDISDSVQLKDFFENSFLGPVVAILIKPKTFSAYKMLLFPLFYSSRKKNDELLEIASVRPISERKEGDFYIASLG